jgi:hypothetical protein
MTEKEVKQGIIRHIRSNNKVLSIEYLEQLSLDELMCEVHPSYEEYYERQIRELETKKRK